ncbi:MAG TPA: hypothetical protein VG992_03670 [Candidatus Saccharimonadales bacterium]|nr:hypothetical protein [Candidatus Saccharimonadales bacterium]
MTKSHTEQIANPGTRLTRRGKAVAIGTMVVAGLTADHTVIPAIDAMDKAAIASYDAAGSSLKAAGRFITGAHAVGHEVPTSRKDLDPTQYRIDRIPAAGAFTYAQEIDPDHSAFDTYEDMEKQLGHAPQPGENVEVSKDAVLPPDVDSHPAH